MLTGETGAGKSILLDSVSLALGGRGDGGLVPRGRRSRAPSLPSSTSPSDHLARAIAAQAEIDTEGDLILRRVQMADGAHARLRQRPDRERLQVLRAIGATLVEIHAQNARPGAESRPPPRTAPSSTPSEACSRRRRRSRSAARTVREARQALERHAPASRLARREADYLRHCGRRALRLGAEGRRRKAGLSPSAAPRDGCRPRRSPRNLAEAYDSVAERPPPSRAISAAGAQLERRAHRRRLWPDPTSEGASNGGRQLVAPRLRRAAAPGEATRPPRSTTHVSRGEERLTAPARRPPQLHVAPDDLRSAERFAADLARDTNRPRGDKICTGLEGAARGKAERRLSRCGRGPEPRRAAPPPGRSGRRRLRGAARRLKLERARV